MILFGGLIACLCSSTIAMGTFYLFGSAPIENYVMGWFTWWIGDSVGAILVAIPLLMFFGKNTNLEKRQKWGVGLSFSTLCIAMVLFYNGVGESRQQEFYDNFKSEVAARTVRIEQSITAALDMLHAVEGLFGASDTVSRDNFRAFSAHMFAEMSGVQAVAWIPRINQTERAQYEEQVRQEGLLDFKITERNEKGDLVVAGERQQYFPVHFVGPADSTPKVVGFDLASNKLRFAALSKALATDKMVATAPITLVEDTGKQQSILIFNPIFERPSAGGDQQVRPADFKGFALGVFRVEEMVDSAFVGLQHKHVVNVHIQDVTDTESPTLLYGQAIPPSRWFNITKTIEVGSRIWRLSYVPTEAFGALYLKDNLWVLLVSGLLFSSLCVLLILLVAGRGSLMQRLVDETTQDLEETRRYINGITDNAPVLLAYMGIDLRYRFVNSTYEKWIGVPKGDIIGRTLEEVIGTETFKQAEPNIKAVLAGEIRSFDAKTSYNNGEDRHIHATYTPDIAQNGKTRGFFISVEDVTTLKQSQEILLRANESLEEGVKKRTASLELIKNTTVGANLASNMLAAMMNALDNICTFMDWPLGHYYQYNAKTDRMEPSGIWYMKDQGSFKAFKRVTEQTTFARGEGIPGQVLKTGKPLWLDDIQSTKNCLRNEEFIQSNLVAGAAFPVMVGKQVVAVLEFFDTKALGYDEVLQETMATIGTQLGRAVERSQQQDNLQRLVEERTAALAEKEKRLQSIIDTAVDGFVSIDENGLITSFNPAAETMFGFKAQEVLRKNVALLMPGDIASVHDAYLAHYEKTGKSEIINKRTERQGVRKDGSIFPIDVAINRVDLSGEQKIFTGIIRDITDRKTAETELLKAKESAESANRQKSEFLAVMSHEIRTPMNGVLGTTDLLLDTKLTAKQRHFAETTLSSAEALLEIINDILDFSKIEAGKMELENVPFDMLTLVEDITDIITPKCAEKGIELLLRYAPSTPRYVVGDPGKIRQILLNLTSNAIKFTGEGHVLIDMKAEPREDGRLDFSGRISDTGIGVAEDKQDIIFNQFDQADQSTTRQYGGTGLGLPICKRLVQLMEGDIGVESQVDEGSCFWFNIVLEENEDPEFAGDHKAFSSNLENAKMLVVDDNKIARDIIVEHLSTVASDVVSASSGQEALDQLKNASDSGKPFDFAIADYRMPHMDGIEFTNKVMADKSLSETLIVMVTSSPARGDGPAMDKIGISGYLSKPVRASDLHPILQHIWDLKATGEKPNHLVTCHTIREAYVAVHKVPVLEDTHILLADDNPVNQMIASIMLKKYGCEVTSVVNGQKAFDAAKDQGYDAIIMDCQMPELDGYEATKKIRDHEQEAGLKPIPIIAYTANAMKGDREKCLEAGMDDYLSKPVNKRELEVILGKWLPHKIVETD
ncbi:MAG: response regulator [Kordiimonadaceae bacterium]|nr:response regulator [Kordiimonadaceae bacterium]